MAVPGNGESAAAPVPRFSLRWWTGNQGLAGVVQTPNPAILVWFLALVVRWTGVAHDRVDGHTLSGIGVGALLVWALDELLRGTNPLRRLMGLVVCAYVMVRLVMV